MTCSLLWIICRGRPGAKILEQEAMNTKGGDDKVQKDESFLKIQRSWSKAQRQQFALETLSALLIVLQKGPLTTRCSFTLYSYPI